MLPNAQGVFENPSIYLSGFCLFMHKHDLVSLRRVARRAIEHINEEAFSPGAFAAIIRRQRPHDLALSFICADDGETIASVPDDARHGRRRAGHLLDRLPFAPRTRTRHPARELVRIAVERPSARGRKPSSSSAIRLCRPFSFERWPITRPGLSGAGRSGPGAGSAARRGRAWPAAGHDRLAQMGHLFY